jgi:hypothetical protein
VDVVVSSIRRVLTTVPNTLGRFAGNQTASQDRGGQAEKRTSFDLAHKLPLAKSFPIAAKAHRLLWAVMWESDDARVE